MAGGVSHVDSFDHKPVLEKLDGKMADFDDARTLAKTGMGATQRVMKSLSELKPRGEIPASQGFGAVPAHGEHGGRPVLHQIHAHRGCGPRPGNLFLHTGSTNFIRPSMGSWVSYGLGR